MYKTYFKHPLKAGSPLGPASIVPWQGLCCSPLYSWAVMSQLPLIYPHFAALSAAHKKH